MTDDTGEVWNDYKKSWTDLAVPNKKERRRKLIKLLERFKTMLCCVGIGQKTTKNAIL